MYYRVMDDSLKHKVLEFYLEQFDKGQPMSQVEISRRSMEIFGENITIDQIHQWSKDDDWISRIRNSLDTSPALKPKKELFDMWLRIWGEAESPKDKATAAYRFSTSVQAIPPAFRSFVSEDIIRVKEEIRDYIKWYDQQSGKNLTRLGAFTQAYLRLDQSVDVFVEIEHDGVNLDSVVLGER